MEQRDLERRLVRCRYLITRGAVERLGLRDAKAIEEDKDSFIRECHSVFKKAESILTASILQLEDEMERLLRADKELPLLRRYAHWIRIIASSYESFLWLRFQPPDIVEIYKGPKHGRLRAQNVESVLVAARHHNENPYAFAVALDFTRFSCVADLLVLERNADETHTIFVEVKEGSANEEIFELMKSKDEAQATKFFDKYGEKGLQQVERFIRQMEMSEERGKLIEARPGTYKRGRGTRTVGESRGVAKFFTAEVEDLCHRAKRGEYAAEVFDNCLMVGALDPTRTHRLALAEFDTRLLAFNAFISTSNSVPDDLVSELRKIRLINWLEGLGSIFFIPPLLRRLSTSCFLDLLFGRVLLYCYFDAPRFLQLCRGAGVKAGFVKKKQTNRLKSLGGWRPDDYPMFQGRALAYMAGKVPIIIGSSRLHDMAFNWRRPRSVVEQIADAASQMRDGGYGGVDSSEKITRITERDLEC